MLAPIFSAWTQDAPDPRAAGRFVFGKHAVPDDGVPTMHILSDATHGNVQDLCVGAKDLRRVILDGKPIGSVWGNADADYCLLCGIHPNDPSASREAQALDVFTNIERALALHGFAFTDVARTWIYMDDLLDWYDPFNAVRSDFFASRGVFDNLVPASTGIGAKNAAGSAIVASAMAVRPKSGGNSPRVIAVPSPLQCPATDYRSSFSRAVEISGPQSRDLTISGTAAIAPDGQSLHPGDCAAQIRLSFEVVAAILQSRHMDWSHVTRSIAYLRDRRDLPVLDRFLSENHLAHLPMLKVEATVCRDDLLFEIELDASFNNCDPPLPS